KKSHRKSKKARKREEEENDSDKSGDDYHRRKSSLKESDENKKKHRRKEKKNSKKKEKKKKDKDKEWEEVERRKKQQRMGAVNQNDFGKWGVLKESDFFTKQREFEVWMVEQKGIGNLDMMAKWETKEYFKGYMEDFNTATLPHPKYVDLEKWEIKEYNRKKAKEARKRTTGDSEALRQDEMEVQRNRIKKKELANQEFDRLVKASITGKKRESMQSQDLLRAEMQMAYKQGDMTTVKRIEKRLEPDEMEGWR
ncbi:unnamed protein product, partial [Choristocarpus tenellus]